MTNSLNAVAGSGIDAARTRRPRREVHDSILESARALFAAKGYAGATTKEIAQHAGVHEVTVFRRFESKAKLFEAAVLVPFDEAITTSFANWDTHDSDITVEEMMRAFVEPLFALLSDNRDLALALVASRGFPHEAGDDAAAVARLTQVLRRMQPHLEIEAERRGLRVTHPATLLAGLAMVVGMTLLDQNALVSSPDWATHQQLSEEMVAMMLYGVAPRPDAATTDLPAMSLLLDRVVDAERRAARAELELEQCRAQLATLTGPPA